MPVEADSSGDMPLFICRGIHIHLDQLHGGVREMSLDPLCIDECLRMNVAFVLRHVDLLTSKLLSRDAGCSHSFPFVSKLLTIRAFLFRSRRLPVREGSERIGKP